MASDLDKVIKNKLLRNNEYYDSQQILDELYARSKRGDNFNELMKYICDDRNIKLAYRNIKRNKGSNTAGVNGHTISRFGNMNTEQMIKYVNRRLENYIPMKVKFKEIPKQNGKKRPLGIPTIEDRLIQQCIKQILEPICEAKFYNHSYGFRANRSSRDAIARMNILINKSHLHYAVDVDIKGFFDNVNHSKLIKQMWSLGIRDKKLLKIISKMLKAEIEGKGIPQKGTPQGGILSPLLSNIVLNELDWWISNQWEGIETRHQYSGQDHKYRALRTTNLKEIYIVRYADDFKILCRDYKTAQRIYIATRKWLKERLFLDISPEKSGVTNLRKQSTDFLGLTISTRMKGRKRVVTSKLSQKSKEKIKKELARKLKYIRNNPNSDSVNMLNATILGQHNYYNMATNVAKEFNRIWFDLRKKIYNNTKSRCKYIGKKNKAYMKFYGKFRYKVIWISEIPLFPINGVNYKNPLAFTQEKCNYTKQGRILIHSELKNLNLRTLKYIMSTPVKNETEEYNDNRISLYCGQNGKCAITGEPLEIGDFETHHKTPKHSGGTDEYSNLVMIKNIIHKIIHIVDEEKLSKYLEIAKLNDKQIIKINNFRKLAGNQQI